MRGLGVARTSSLLAVRLDVDPFAPDTTGAEFATATVPASVITLTVSGTSPTILRAELAGVDEVPDGK